MLRPANELGAAKDRDKLAWSRIEPQIFGAGTARFCRTRPNTVNQLHLLHRRMSPVSSARGSQLKRVREHSGGAQEVLECRCGVGKLHDKAARHSWMRR